MSPFMHDKQVTRLHKKPWKCPVGLTGSVRKVLCIPSLLHENSAAGALLSVHRRDMVSSELQNGLQYLDFSNMDLKGSLPSCLLSAPGSLSQIGFSSNNLTGTIPDVIPTNTSLYSLVLDNNNLTGSIPATLVNARLLSSLELYSNKLAGSIPDDFGAGMYMLQTVLLFDNNITGKQGAHVHPSRHHNRWLPVMQGMMRPLSGILL